MLSAGLTVSRPLVHTRSNQFDTALPTPLPSAYPYPFLPLHPTPLEVGPFNNSWGGWGSAVSSPAGSGAQQIEFGAF